MKEEQTAWENANKKNQRDGREQWEAKGRRHREVVFNVPLCNRWLFVERGTPWITAPTLGVNQ
eukprot:SAG31_NODE_117_length_24022_cov_6.878067_17_plen_63_part_00